MNSNNATRLPKSGLQVDRITRIIIEQWPEIWQASINRQNQQLENQRNLMIAARNRMLEKAS